VRIIGADISGAESLASICDDTGSTALARSCAPLRPASVLLPLIRSEKVVAGDRALLSERGLGLPWPPLSHATGSETPEPPVENSQGRVLIASAWHRLATATDWQASKWSPPDGLPQVTKPAPALCIEHERRALIAAHADRHVETSFVLAVPNHLPEESQQALLNSLPPGSRLVWRAVAAAMKYLDRIPDQAIRREQLTVIDVGPSSIERSKFTIRRITAGGEIFFAPVRKVGDLKHWPISPGFFETAFSPHGFAFDPERLKTIALTVLGEPGEDAEVILCGPGATAFVAAANASASLRNVRTLPHSVIAEGASLFGRRLTLRLPTYFDQLPSLELFTLTQTREPRWLSLIPPNHEIQGGDLFQVLLPRTAFVREGIARVPFWLQRSGEAGFRKLTTDLPLVAASDTWTDFSVNAASAGGFASVRMTPSRGEPDIFGQNQSVQLNWLSMERVDREPGQKWPIKIEHGWPACGKLYAYKAIFSEFLDVSQNLASDLASGGARLAHRLAIMKAAVKKTTAPRFIGITAAADDGAPISQLLTFGTECPAVFVAALPNGKAKLTPAESWTHAHGQKIADTLWNQLKRTGIRGDEEKYLIYIIGRMGGYAPDAFADLIARRLTSTSKDSILFPAGRVLRTPGHGNSFFRAVARRGAEKGRMNNSWLRAIVYATYQHEELLCAVPREHLFTAFDMCVDELQRLVDAQNARIGFVNCLRTLALLLRARRYAATRDFLCIDSCPPHEKELVAITKRVLRKATYLSLSEQKESLLNRLRDWIDFSSDTDEMPPITTDDEESGEDEED
jgi:hypothetical protein